MNLGVCIWDLKQLVGVGVRQWEFPGSGNEGRPKHRETWASAPWTQVCRKHQVTASGDKQDAQGTPSDFWMCPSTGLAVPRARPRGSAHTKQAADAIQPGSQSKPKPAPHSGPPWRWTRNDTIPSVIKVGTQSSRALHARGTPAHTGDDIRDRNRNGGRKEEAGTGWWV